MQEKLSTDFLNTGVVVARFQVPELHQGHHDLIRKVKQYHKKVIIFLGVTSTLDTDNPLDYPTRERMVKKHYPDITVAPISNSEYDDVWAETLDNKIREIEPRNKILLYGSRDSFIKYYKPYGKFECIDFLPDVDMSGTEMRAEVCNEVRDTEDFRRGLIYEKHNSWPKVFPTVDIIITRNNKGPEILLGQKHKEMKSGKWRIPGGFIEKRHSGGLNAAVAETKEETDLTILPENLTFITQMNIDDWRIRKSKDVIMTTLFHTHISDIDTSNLAKAGDDLGAVKWFKLSEALEIIHPIHKPLLEAYLQKII
jgi:bifunctional NMN adenylyltransferase/nudix hydrolase